MSAGRFRDRVTFQRAGEDDDGMGNIMSGDWANIEVSAGVPLTVWADVLERLGGERLASGALEAPRMATVRVRRSTAALGVTEADRMIARGMAWNIRSIAEVGRKGTMIEFTVEANTAGTEVAE